MHWSDAEVRFSGVMKRAGATVAKDGMNVLEVEEVLSSFGFLVKTYYTDWQQISERKQIGIVFIRKPGAKIGHFVAARGRGHDQVEVFDAPKRPSILNISQMPDETIVFIELRLAEK